MARRIIPFINDKDLHAALARLTPVVEAQGRKYLVQSPHDPRKQSFLYFWTAGTSVPDDWEVFGVIATRHPLSRVRYFQPRFAEVAAQIPRRLQDQVVGFETRTSTLRPYDSKHGSALTVLYRKRTPSPQR